MTPEEILKLDAVIPLSVAAKVLNVGQNHARDLARAGEFLIPAERIAGKWKCYRSDLLRKLGIRDPYARDDAAEPAA